MTKKLMQNSLRVQVERLWRIITILIFLISIVGMPTTVAKAAGVSEGFESGWTDHAFIDNANWYSANGIYVENDFGIGGTWGLSNSANIFTWMGHPFQWSDPTLTGVLLGMDFQTNASSQFDDDRVGWMIAGSSTVSDNFFGVQLDPGGSGQNIEAYWDGVTVNDGGRTSIANLTGLSANAWYRLRAEITKLTATSARIDVTLTALDAGGNPGALVASGTIVDTSLLPDTTDNYKPKSGYFTATTMYPAYKNHNGTTGNADNAYFEILTGTPIPTISVIGTPLTAFSSLPSIPSAEKSYSVSGSNLTDNIAISAPADFQISTTSGSGFGSSVTLIQSGGSVAVTPIYVHFNRATEGVSSGNITHTSSGATAQNVAVSGTATASSTVTFAAFGDYGSNSSNELAVSNMVKGWNPDFIVTTGDNSYGSTAIDDNIGKYYNDYIGNYTGSYGSGSATNKFFPAMGNHDYTDGGQSAAYFSYFTLPSNERYFDFVQGPIHFFVIDSNPSGTGSAPGDGRSPTSAQGIWLQAQLAASTSPWNIVYMHHPPFSSGSGHGSEMAMQWPYEAWGATAVLAGHDHVYERIHHDDNSDGVVLPYFTTGAGGMSLYSFNTPVTGSQVRYSTTYGSMKIQASAASITFEFWSVDGGGTLRDTYTINSTPTETLPINTGSDWKYLDNGSDQGTAWKELAFDDTAWALGPAELGYGDSDEDTTVDCSAVANCNTNNYITTYFRKTFNVPDKSIYSGLNLSLLRDDGAVVYLNGTEVWRTNMPAGAVSNTTLATAAISGTDETTFVNPGAALANTLVNSTNVLAVEIHQSGATSTDISFDLALTGITAAPTCYPLTLGHIGSGTTPTASPTNSTGCSAGQYIAGATVNLSGATPDAGSEIFGWTGTTNNSSTGNTNTVTMPASAHTASVTYSLIGTPQTLPIVEGNTWRYFKGTAEPPSTWKNVSFTDSSWLTGASGFGYGDNDDNTTLSDMLNGYLSLYARKAFTVANPAAVSGLQFSIDFDDAFVAYLNGTEIARNNVTGTPPAYNTVATGDHEASSGDSSPQPVQVYTVDPALLVTGTNVLAIQGHNKSLTSTDFSLIPELSVVVPPTCYALTLGHTGNGTTPTASPTNSTGCSAGQYIAGATVNLSGALADSGWHIASWTGTTNNSSTASTNSVTMPASAHSAGVNYAVGSQSTVTFKNGVSGYSGTVDTHIVQNEATTAHGALESVEWDNDDPSGTGLDKYGLIRFDNIFGPTAGQIPLGATVQSATLRYVVFDAGVSADVNEVAIGWTESETWNGFGGDAGVQADEYGTARGSAAGTTGIQSVDVTASLVAWANNPSANLGWILRPTDTDGVDFRSSEYATVADRPSLEVTYSTNTVTQYTLTVNAGANGSVTLNPAGGTYPAGMIVQLTAVPNTGYALSGWSGDLSGSTNPVTITMNSNKTVGAAFVQLPQVNLTTNVVGNGSITLNPTGGTYPQGTVVQLTAVPASGYVFSGWSGDLTGATNPANITMNAVKSVTATFTEPGSSLVGYWRFDETSGTTADDSSTYGNDGALVSGPTWTTGIEGGALSFDGTNDHVELPNSPSLSLNTNQVTFTGWVYPTDLDENWSTLIQRSNTADTGYDYQIYARASDSITSFHPTFRVDWNQNNLNDYNDEEVEGNIILQIDTWYYITATYDGADMKFYIDGTLRDTTPIVGGVIPNSNTSTWIGGNDVWGEYFTGKIDEFRIYNKALNQTEIQALMVQHSLTVNVVGSGSVTRNPNKTTYNNGEVVQLSPTPAAGWSFSSWSGACTGTGACSVTMDADKSVTATFTQNEYTLTVTPVGSGSVTRSNPGPYHLGDIVNLTPVPAAEWTFSSWSGACTGSGACSVTMDANKTVTATFTQNEFTLTVNTVGSGSVTRSNPGPYHLGDVVNLTPVPVAGWNFSSWSGACTGSGACSVTMDANKTVTATFTQTSTEPDSIQVYIGGVNQGNYPLVSGESMVKKYALDGGPVEISSNNGTDIVASLNQWRRRPSTTVGWTGVSQSMALPLELITDQYVMPRYDYSNTTALYNALLLANVDTVSRDITVKIGGTVKGTYTIGASQSQFVTYPGVVGGPVVVSSVSGAKIVASLYELIRDPSLPGWNGQSEMMGIPLSQLSDKYIIPIYFGAANPITLNAKLFIANADTIGTTIEIKIAGISRGTYALQPNTGQVVAYNIDGGPVEISSNNGAKIVASLNQWRRRPSTKVGWTGVSQSMALPVELITDQYVMPRYDYSNTTALYNALLLANVDTVSRDITVKIGGTVKGTYTIGASQSQFVSYGGVVGGPVVVSSVSGARIVASLYELIRDPSLPGWNGQSEMMGIPLSQLSDKYIIPIYFGAANPITLNASLYIGVP